MRCPRCNSTEIRRSGEVPPWYLALVCVYGRCEECSHLFLTAFWWRVPFRVKRDSTRGSDERPAQRARTTRSSRNTKLLCGRETVSAAETDHELPITIPQEANSPAEILSAPDELTRPA